MQTRTVVLIILTGIACSLFAGDVTIIREAPVTGTNRVEAQWHNPNRNLDAVAPASATELAGRIDLGGTGQDPPNTELGFDFYTNSNLKIVQSLGSGLFIQLTADAIRKQQLDGFEQQYGGTFLFSHELIRLDFSGQYRDTLVPGPTGAAYDQDTLLKAAVYTTLIPNIPVTLSGMLDWKAQKQDELPTAGNSNINAGLKADGDLGAFRFNLLTAYTQDTNTLDQVDNYSLNGNLTLALDLMRFLTLQANLTPVYANTMYNGTGTDFSVTELAGQLGLLFPFSEAFQSRLLFGLTDTSQSAPQSQILSYLGELGVTITDLADFTSAPVYHISLIEQGDITQKLSANLTWAPEAIDFIDNLTAAASWQTRIASDSSPVFDEKIWSLGFKLLPLETLILQSTYSGALLGAADPLLKHKVTALYKHTPLRFLDYAFDCDFNYADAEEGVGMNGKYGAALTLMPQWNLKVYSFSLKETLGLTDDSTGNIVLSKLNFLTAIPVFAAMTARYNLEWEWVNTMSPAAGAGNAFRHLAGITVQAEPVTFLCEYTLGHGFRGLRHDVVVDLALAFFKGFSLHSRFELSAYNLETVPEIPYLFGLNLIYEF